LSRIELVPVLAGVVPPRDVGPAPSSPSLALEVGLGAGGRDAARTTRGLGLGGGEGFASSLAACDRSLVVAAATADAVADALAGGVDDVAATAEADADADAGAFAAEVFGDDAAGGRETVIPFDSPASSRLCFPRRVHALAPTAIAASATTPTAAARFFWRGGR
jgi:hypothetical protein